jgi:hypothetical protein
MSPSASLNSRVELTRLFTTIERITHCCERAACYILGSRPREGDWDQHDKVLSPSAYRELPLRGSGSG